MAGTPEEGQQSVGFDASVNSNFTHTLRLYTNTIGTLSVTSVLADVTEAVIGTHPGYAAVILDNTNYSVSADGVITYSPSEIFVATGAWANVTGAYIDDGSRLRHYSDFPAPVTLADGEALRINITTTI